MNYLERVESIHPDLISQFLATGKCDEIPSEIQLFLQQLQWAMEIYEHEKNIRRAAKRLRERINTCQHIKIELRTCHARLYEAINYFHVDNNVPIKIWEGLYADQFENLAKLCALAGDYKTQSKCYERALECRRRAAEIAETNRDLGITILYEPTITPELMGFEKKSMKQIAAKYNEGFYARLIADLPVENAEKKRLLRDADIEKIEEAEEVEND